MSREPKYTPEEDLLRESMAYLAILNAKYFRAYDILCESKVRGWSALYNLWFFIEPKMRQEILSPDTCISQAKKEFRYEEKVSKLTDSADHNKKRIAWDIDVKGMAALILAEHMVAAFEALGATHRIDSRRLLGNRRKGSE